MVPNAYNLRASTYIKGHIKDVAEAKATFSVAAKDRFLNELSDKYAKLSAHPYMGQAVAGKSYRKISLDNGRYRLLYEVDDKQSLIVAFAIVHSSEQLP